MVGPLDLNATALDFELIAVNCYFDGVVDLGDAQTRSLELAACRVMALNMWYMRVDGGLDFYGLMCGSIVLGNSRIAGDLRLDEATFSELAGEGVVVDGMVDLSRRTPSARSTCAGPGSPEALRHYDCTS